MDFKTCKRCSYKWQPRVDRPKRCPGCKSQYWDTEKTRISRKYLEE